MKQAESFARTMDPVSGREYLLILGTLFFIVSPVLVIVFYAAAALATFLQWQQIRLDKEKVAIGLLILVISLWMFHRKVLPEHYSPGWVAFSVYVPPFIFFYVMSLVPFSDSECEHISYALLTTVPQQFITGFWEKYCHWRGPISYSMNGVPIVDMFIGSYKPGLSVSATLYNPNILALFGVMVFAVSVGLFLREIKKIKTYDKAFYWLWVRIIFTGSCIILSLLLILWTDSRNGLAAALFVAVCQWILNRKMALVKAIGGGMIVFILLASSNVGLPARLVRHHAWSATAGRFSDSVHTPFLWLRSEVYSYAVQLVEERPIEGWGLGMLREEFTRRIHGDYATHAHNIFLQLAAEIGLPFAAATIGLFSYVFIVSLRRLARKAIDGKVRDIDLTLLIVVGAVLLMQVFDLALLMTYRLSFLFWVCFAIIYSRAVRQKEKVDTFAGARGISG